MMNQEKIVINGETFHIDWYHFHKESEYMEMLKHYFPRQPSREELRQWTEDFDKRWEEKL